MLHVPEHGNTKDSKSPQQESSNGGNGESKAMNIDLPIQKEKNAPGNPMSPRMHATGNPMSPRMHQKEHGKDHGKDHAKVKADLKSGVISDIGKMKDELHENLEVREYNVFDFYHETGYWQALAKSDRFSNLTLGIISLNAVWIGVDSDHNTKPPPHTDLQFVAADQFFCVFFSFEWLTRFLAFAKKRNCLKDGWFKFDSALVFLMVFETWLTPLIFGAGGGGGGMGDASMLRLLRLLRLTRMARLMRSVPELVTLLKGMAAAVRSVSSVLVLLMIFTYVFAIIFKQQTEGDEALEEKFGTIPEAMWNLLMVGTLLDNITDVLNLLRERSPIMCAVFLSWVLLSSFTMLNMLIGVLCEVVAAVSDAEKEKNAVSFAKNQFLEVLDRLDEDRSGALSEAEFENFVMDADCKSALDDLEVDRENLLGLSDVIFSAKEEKGKPAQGDATRRASLKDSKLVEAVLPTARELEFGELLEMILDLRASNPAMVSHIVDLRKHLRSNQKENNRNFQEIDTEIEEVKLQQEKIMTRQDEIVDRLDNMVSEMIGPLMCGIRELQENFGCSNLVPIPNSPVTSNSFEGPAAPTLPTSPRMPSKPPPTMDYPTAVNMMMDSPNHNLRKVAAVDESIDENMVSRSVLESQIESQTGELMASEKTIE